MESSSSAEARQDRVVKPLEADKWLYTARPLAAPRVRVVCLPYAGGGATIFHAWDKLATDIEVCAVQLPARQQRLKEPGITSVSTIVERLVEALASRPAAPLALYGHSFGALVAFELSRRLSAKGSPPIALVVGARGAPQLPLPCAPIHGLSRDAFVQEIHDRYGTPLEVLQDPELSELILPPLRADMTALERYVFAPGSKLDVPITALRGTLDGAIGPAMMQSWADVTTHPLALREVHAGHFFVDTHRAWVQEKLVSAIAAATRI